MHPIKEFRLATEQERMYTYAQSHEIQMKTGMIGYLRGDFGTNGGLFYTTWFDAPGGAKTQTFKDEFDDLVNALRSDPEFRGILKSRTAMFTYCHTVPESEMEGNYTTEYAFRADTDTHAVIMRLNPTKGDYNFSLHCFEKSSLDRHLAQSAKGIRFITPDYAEKFRIPDGDQIRMIRPEGDHIDRTVRYIDDYHLEVGYGIAANLYHICEFAERMEQNGTEVIPLRSSLPEQCYSVLPTTGEIIIVKKGESGYYKTDLPNEGKEENRETVDACNKTGGVTRAQEEAMRFGSMFGWASPAADPKNYTEDGVPIKPSERNRGEAR